MDKKRDRSVNFTTVETQLLVDIVRKHQNTIENKRTDAVTNKEKEDAWCKIAVTFNASGISSTARTPKMIKQKYESIKKLTKKKSAVRRQDMYKTGGGPSSAPDFTDVEDKILSICTNITGLESRYDSDNILAPELQNNKDENVEDYLVVIQMDDEEKEDNTADIQQPNEPKPVCNTEIPKDEDQDVVMESPDINKWNYWTPKSLKSKVNPLLKINKAGVTAKFDKLSTARIELVELQKQVVMEELKNKKEEQNLKREEHALKIELMRNEEKRRQEAHDLAIKNINDCFVFYLYFV